MDGQDIQLVCSEKLTRITSITEDEIGFSRINKSIISPDIISV